MKNIAKHLLFIVLLGTTLQAQQPQTVDICGYNSQLNMDNKYFKDLNNVLVPFIGTWKWVNGNQTFKVIIWKEEMVQNFKYQNCYQDKFYGDWMMIENEGTPNETIIYQSNKYLGNGQNWPPAMFGGGTCDGIKFKCMLIDNCIDHPTYTKNGDLEITLLSGTNTAHWEVSELKGTHLQGRPSFRIPTDIILTKVN